MPSYRTDQVGAQVREEIMGIIRRELKDPRIGFVSITGVRMSSDLRSARVRISVLGDEDEQKATLKGLNSARGLIRHELGRTLHNLKFAPELRFELDPSIEYSVRISKMLREILPEEASSGEPSAGDAQEPSASDAQEPKAGGFEERKP
jgi:ribosome-binding factor A